ncbi:MAG: phosphoribosylglycinamide formyltransferase [Cryomorphaceae bacterium]|nr:phosphoribosylglycinamide formyltransferase [Cryomorphaceae bacterium]
MLRIAVLASGSGSNAEELHRYFSNSDLARVELIVTNNTKAGVIDRFSGKKVAIRTFDPSSESDTVLQELTQVADLVILAGYLRMIPASWTRAFQGRMLNIHPALLPKFGGKGMYGKHVHQAVSEASETETGITIHLVNEHYDEGAIVAQFAVDVAPGESPLSIEEKVRQLELEYYGPTVERWIENLTLSQ